MMSMMMRMGSMSKKNKGGKGMPMGMGMAKGMGKMPPEMAKAMSKGKPMHAKQGGMPPMGHPGKMPKGMGKKPENMGGHPTTRVNKCHKWANQWAERLCKECLRRVWLAWLL